MLSKCLNCRNKQWKECCYKCREPPYEHFICKAVIKENDRIYHMSKHYNEAGLHLTFMLNLNRNSFILGLKQINADYVFIYIDIGLAVQSTDLEGMLKYNI